MTAFEMWGLCSTQLSRLKGRPFMPGPGLTSVVPAEQAQQAQQRQGRPQQGSAFTMADLLRNLQSQQAGRQPQQSRKADPAPSRYSDSMDGPVIDAEWTTIDEDR